jgi:hypothetical protein
MNRTGIDIGSTTLKIIVLDTAGQIVYKVYCRHRANILQTLTEALNGAASHFPGVRFTAGITGSAGMGVALESERKSFSQNKITSEHKLQDIVRQADGYRETAGRIKGDWKDVQSRVPKNADGAFLNPVQLKGVEGSDPKTIGIKLNEIADKTNTNGEYFKIGSLYGFTLQVKTEKTQKEGLFMRENRFFVEGEGNIKYSYNNGHIAADPVLASQNFLKALEKMPSLIETYEAKAQALAKDIPALQEVVKTVWRKEEELKDLKTEPAALNRNIELSLKPVDGGEDKKEEKQENRLVFRYRDNGLQEPTAIPKVA